MTFDQVLVFHKIVQSGSFKAAAGELHRTQPAISLAIKKLEEEMEVDLFDRSGYRPELTAHGKAFFERSQKLLQGMEELENLSEGFRNKEEPEITISVDGISPLPKLLHLFKSFGQKYPNTKLNLDFNILAETERRVLQREAQIGITHFLSDENALEVVPITTVRMIPVMSRELFKQKKVKAQSDLLDIEQIVVGDKIGPKGTSFGLLDGGKKWRITDSNFKRDIIMAGLGWGHLAEHNIAREIEEKKLAILNFEDIHPRELDINLIRLKKHQLGVVGKNLWQEFTMNLLFIFFLFCPAVSFSAVIEAPILPLSYQQNPTDVEWKHITTEHFDIIFPGEIEGEAQRTAHLLEKAYPYVTRSLEVKPPKIPLVLQNRSLTSNGFVTLAPRRSEFYVTPSIDPELTNTEWLKTLAIHELRHVVQFQKTRQGFNRGLEILLGEAGQALGLGLTLPPWFLEGDAVGIETALTPGGRGRLPLFERDLRALLLAGNHWDYDKAHLGSYEDYVPNHYVYGYFLTTYLRNEYGDLFLSKLADRSAQNSWNPLNFYNAVEDLTGKSFEEVYRNAMKHLLTEWKKKIDELKPTPYTVKTVGKGEGWTNYLFPQFTSDGKMVALKKGLSSIEQFVLLDGSEEKVLFYPSNLQQEYPYKLRNDRLAFIETELHPRWGYQDYGRLKVYDLKKKKFILNKGETKARLAVLDHSGEKVLFVEWGPSQKQTIVVMDLDGKELKRIPYPTSEVITSIDWINDNEVAAVVRNQKDQKAIKKLNLETAEEKELVNESFTNIGFVSSYDGKIFFESPRSGIDNIWLIQEDGTKQLTNSLFGAYAPVIHNNKLIYNNYSVHGMNIVEKALPWNETQESKDSFYPIFEKFSKSENFPAFDSDLSEIQQYKVKDYSQFKNAINLHSWVLLAPPLSSTITVAGVSRDILNKFSLTAGGLYNLNESTVQGFVGSVWSHFYPVFDLRAAYGSRRQNLLESGEEIENKWEEGTLEAGVSVPWRFLQGRFMHSFTARAFSRLIKVTNKLSRELSEISDGVLYSPGLEASYSVLSRLARRDLNPSLGFDLDLRAEEGRDISGDDQRGRIRSAESTLFLPGFIKHHSFYHQFVYEKQDDDFYQYATSVLYPRGTRSFFLQELTKYSGNYLLPMFYPDWSMSRYLYLKRISLNLFYDELKGRFEGTSYRAASTGWETLFEMHFARIFLPLTIGLRGSYVLEGAEQGQDYEVFLATSLGAF